MSARYCAGVDLGTTNTVCAVWQEGASEPEVIPILQQMDDYTEQGARKASQLASALTAQELDGEWRIFVGGVATMAMKLRQGRSFTSIKRFMGRTWSKSAAGVSWTPELVSASILTLVRRELDRRFEGQPEQVVITVPASFGTEARRATLRAAQLAGFDLGRVTLFDEPAAALLAQVLADSSVGGSGKQRLSMVVDIGGGTLDVSIVAGREAAEGIVFDMVGQSRLNELAGDDFDLNIAGLLLDRFERETGQSLRSIRHSNRRAQKNLKRQFCTELVARAEEAKRDLSDALQGRALAEWPDVKVPVELRWIPKPIQGRRRWRTELTGADLATALREYFPMSKTGVARGEFGFFRPIHECLDSAAANLGKAVELSGVDELWLAGGTAKLPIVRHAVEIVTGRPVSVVEQPMLSVARGAAIRAADIAGFGSLHVEVKERLFDGIYIETSAGFRELLPPNLQLPHPPEVFADLFRMPLHSRSLAVNLYIGRYEDAHLAGGEEGASVEEPDLAPLARKHVEFPDVILEEGLPVSVHVEVSRNREVLLDFLVNDGENEHHGDVAVTLVPGVDLEHEQVPALLPDREPSS